jgi:hypothetical protein
VQRLSGRRKVLLDFVYQRIAKALFVQIGQIVKDSGLPKLTPLRIL